MLEFFFIHRLSQQQMSTFCAVIRSVILSKNMYKDMCFISKVFHYWAIWLYSSLALAPDIVLPSRRITLFSEASESVWSVSWLLWKLIVTLHVCCEKWRTSLQMPNIQIWCTFTASPMAVPLLLLKNTVGCFSCAEFRIADCFPRCSVYCVNPVAVNVCG